MIKKMMTAFNVHCYDTEDDDEDDGNNSSVVFFRNGGVHEAGCCHGH